MTYDELYPGRFMSAVTIGDTMPTLTIADVYHEDLEGDKGAKQKVIMKFREPDVKQLVFAKINAACCRDMFGPDAKLHWLGKRITLYSTNQIMAFPRKYGDNRPRENCVRVFGSPDITADVAVEFCFRQRTIYMTMRPTKKPFTVQPLTDAAPKAANEWDTFFNSAGITMAQFKEYMDSIGMPSLRDLDVDARNEILANPQKYGAAVRAFGGVE